MRLHRIASRPKVLVVVLGVFATACVSAGDFAAQPDAVAGSRAPTPSSELGASVETPAPARAGYRHRGVSLVSETVRIAVPEGGYSVAATILRPSGPGKWGAIVLNHGVPVSERDRLRESAAEDFKVAAAEFASRGYVVVMPMRRGFGATGGEFAEDAGPCSAPDYAHGEAQAARDVMAAYDYARTLPYVDGDRMILAGHSAGGMVALYTAGARKPAGLRAVLAFAAGRGGNPYVRPGEPCAVEPIARLLESIGGEIEVPVLMHYAENDKYFGPEATRLWHRRLTAAGANAEFAMQPAFGADGHYVFGDARGLENWLPPVERFMAGHGLPFGEAASGTAVASGESAPPVR